MRVKPQLPRPSFGITRMRDVEFGESPIVEGGSVTLNRELDSEEIRKLWKLQFGIELGEKWSNIGHLQELQCDQTGLVFYRPREAAGGPELYEQLQENPWYYQEEKWEHNEAIGILGVKDRILEIGSGTGAFLRKAIAFGLDVSGCETNLKAAAAMREDGLRVYTLPVEELLTNIPGTRFDAICTFQVLEHISEPGSFIRSCLELLAPHGRLVISVPNNARLRHLDPDGQDLLNHPPHHMGKWDENVFRSLEKFFPVLVESVSFDFLHPNHVKPFLRRHIMRAPLFRGRLEGIVSRFSRVLARIVTTLRVNRLVRGDNILVVLRKV